jgi:drug/metabolite transporter (DMT)-like permease
MSRTVENNVLVADKRPPMTKIWKPLFAVTVWGLSFIATKNALVEIKPVVIVFIRQIMGILFLTAVLLKQNKSFAINFKEQKWVFALGAIAGFHLWIQVTGLQWTSASHTGWIIGITPVFMTILALIFFKEKITASQTAGIVISFLGLIFLVSKGDFTTLDLIKNKGDILIIASSITWSIYSLVSKKVTLSLSPVLTTLYLFILVALIMSPFAINAENIGAVIHLSLSGWAWMLFLGIICSGVAYTFWSQALSEMSASRVGVFLYVEPFVTFFGSWVLLNEQITFITLLSGLVIIGGVVLVNRK